MAHAGKVLIYGSSGALGRTCVRHFKQAKWFTIGIGTSAVSETDDVIADKIIVVDKETDVLNQEQLILSELKNELKGSKLDAIITTAGGWQGGNAKKDFSQTLKNLVHSNLYPATISAALGAQFLNSDHGLIVFFGATGALKPTPDMIAYGMIKCAIHQLVRSLGADKSGLPPTATCIGILPAILDTPDNRKWLKNLDVNTFTPLDFLAETFEKWAKNENRPPSGTLLKLVTKDRVTNFEIVE